MAMTDNPNLLIIHTDQQSCWTLGCYGGDIIKTPHIDRMAREGACFRNFFANSAVCTPSRGSFLTGRYPHCHGAYTNNVPLNRDEVTLGHVLKGAGYDTAYMGKWHLDGPEVPGWISPERSMGFDDQRWMFNAGHHKSVIERDGDKPEMKEDIGDERTYMTDWLTDKTIEYLSGRDDSEPFFLMTSIPDPHSPYRVREPYTSMFDPAAIPLPETFGQEDMPAWGKKAYHQVWNQYVPEEWVLTTREACIREIRAQYCGMVKHIDDSVGRMLATLEEQGILDQTIVIFTSDHGDYMGEHGLLFKNYCYEPAHRVPLVVRWPKKIAPETVVDSVLSCVDFQPTLLGLMGIEPSGREQGHDASGIAMGAVAAESDWKNEAMLYHPSHEFAGIFTPEYELVLDGRDGDHALFDRRNDPQQVDNLFGDPDKAAVIEELTRRVVEHHQSVDSPEMKFLSGVMNHV